MIYKRIFDLIFSTIGFILLSPLFVLIALFIKITMPGPVFFCQVRVGKNRKLFKLVKFRSMTILKNSENGYFDIGNNARVTSFGKLLRKTKLDELPQLFNVLKGEMSIVGPRPEVQCWTDIYTDKWDIILTVKPGITDNASIHFRNEEYQLINSRNPEQTYKDEILPKKIDYYIDYVNNNTLLSDVKIIFRTFHHILTK